MLERCVSVELKDSSIPLHAVERNVVNLVAAVQLSTLSPSDDFRVDCQRKILQSFARAWNDQEKRGEKCSRRVSNKT